MNITDKRTAVLLHAITQYTDGMCDGKYGQPSVPYRDRDIAFYPCETLFADEYGEPGCICESGVIAANWNRGHHPLSKRACDYLEAAGFALEWADEWVVDHEGSGKMYRTCSDSHVWLPSLVYSPDYCDVHTCDDDDPERTIDAFMIDDPAQPLHALPYWITAEQLTAYGYERIGADDADDEEGTRFELGLYPGQTDDHSDIARAHWTGETESMVFQITSSGQFDIHFAAWIKYTDADD